jgi:4-hydroxybenzoate polyprenyltransferase
MTEPTTPASSNRLLAYLQLFRLPNVFTAMADVIAGYLLVHPSLDPLPGFLLLLVASCLLYTAGMVLNDVYDIEQDRRQRPQRPLPSGRITLNTARLIGYGMLVAGVAAAGLSGWSPIGGGQLAWRPPVVALLLVACILLYDAALKNTPLGPALMGSCRFLNLLLGASTAAVVGDDMSRLGYSMAELTVAAGLGIYIAGVTLFARTEAKTSNRSNLTTATVIMVFGIVTVLTFPNRLDPNLMQQLDKGSVPLLPPKYWMTLLGLIGLTIVGRCVFAIANPDPRNVQLAVKNAILSLISLNAAIVLQVGGMWYALGVFALVIPAMLLGRWVYST